MVIGDSGDPGTNAPSLVEAEHRHAEEPAMTHPQTMGGTTALGNPFRLRVVIQNAVSPSFSIGIFFNRTASVQIYLVSV